MTESKKWTRTLEYCVESTLNVKNNMGIKIVDGFVWHVVTEMAENIYFSDTFELYALYDDGSESLIVSFEDLQTCLEFGLDIGIEVGKINA